MEVRVHTPDAASRLDRVTHAVQGTDPAAVIDLDAASGALRVSTVMGTTELLGALREGGLEVEADDLRHQPSTCCGGCGG